MSSEVVIAHGDVAQSGIARQVDRDGRRLVALFAAPGARRSPGITIFRSPRFAPPLRDSKKEPRRRHPVVPDGRADHIVRCSNTDKT